MKTLQKSITLFLLLSILCLNLASGVVLPCHAKASKQEKTCCSKVRPVCDQAEVTFSKASCCNFSQGSAPFEPFATSTGAVLINVNKVEKYLVKITILDNSYINPAKFSKSDFTIYGQPKFLSNLKIYSLVSSYLI